MSYSHADYQTAKSTKRALEAEGYTRAERLAEFASGYLGLTPDTVKFSEERREALRAFRAAFAELRCFNAAFHKAFKSEIAADCKRRRLMSM